jgi:hypothetical protein
LGGKLRQIGGTHGVSIAGGAGKRGEVAVGEYLLGEDATLTLEKINRLDLGRRDVEGVLLDQAASGFKAEDARGG